MLLTFGTVLNLLKRELDNSHFLFQIYWFFYIGLQ
jgi:hypothetical protein